MPYTKRIFKPDRRETIKIGSVCTNCGRTIFKEPVKHINLDIITLFCSKKCKQEWSCFDRKTRRPLRGAINNTS